MAAALLLSGCAGNGTGMSSVDSQTPAQSESTQTTGTQAESEESIAAAETTAEVQQGSEAKGLTLERLIKEHGYLVSTTEKKVTEEDLKGIYEAAQAVTVGDPSMWKLTAITNLDLIQELLPTYTEAGLIHEGNVAIIVSCTSDTGNCEQYEVRDNTALVAAGMVTQQICVAAQMQGIGFKVITDCIRESSYTLYRDNVPDEEHLLKEGQEWEEWVTQFAVPKENYYDLVEGGDKVQTIGGDYVTLGNGTYDYYEADGQTPVTKIKTEYIKGYMTPCAVVLLGYSEDAPKTGNNYYQKFVNEWNGKGEAYPEVYGGSGGGNH